MERVAFLIERSGERIACLLNPESFVFRRTAGIRHRAERGGIVSGAALQDDPLIATGGGRTELVLNLLFDVDFAEPLGFGAELAQPPEAGAADAEPRTIEPPRQLSDVRELTRPFWNLAENAESAGGYGAPPVVRFIWGRAWNVPGVITAVAERLERFAADGAPRRSWMSLRLRRVAEATAARAAPPLPVTAQQEFTSAAGEEAAGQALRVELVADENDLPASRLDQLAYEHYGDAQAWLLIAAASNIDDPLSIEAGTVLTIPQLAPGATSP